MADDADRAAKLQAATNASAAAQRKPVPRIEPEGWCHCCGEDVAEGALFCNGECASEFERLEAQRRQRA